MTEIADDLRMLVGSLTAVAPDADDMELWGRLRGAGITRVGAGAADDTGDLGDLAACAEELGKAARSTPLIEHSTAAWALGFETDELTTIGIARHCTIQDGAISGEIQDVRWAGQAEQILVLPETGTPVLLRSRDPRVALDLGANIAGEPVAVVQATTAPVDPVTHAPATGQVLSRLRLLRAAALLGAATAAYELTRDYVRTRRQFSAPLIRVPAVANNLAIMKTELIHARSGLDRACDLYRYSLENAQQETAALVARLVTDTCASEVARLSHQLHGAMGTTAEYPLHQLTRRLWAWRAADTPERVDAITLGTTAARITDEEFWDRICAYTPAP